MPISVRPVGEKDAESIVRLLNDIIRAEVYSIMENELSVDDQIAFIRNLPRKSVYNVAIDEIHQEIVGVQDVLPYATGTSAFEHVGEVSTFVSISRHRSGVGSSLSRETFRAAKELGFRKLMALIRADNKQAIGFYQCQGFEQIGTAKRHALVRGTFVDEVLMEKYLD